MIIIILLLIILLRKRNNYKSPAQENLVDTTTSLNGVQFDSKSGVDKMEQDNQAEKKQNETKETDSLILGMFECFLFSIRDVAMLSHFINVKGDYS